MNRTQEREAIVLALYSIEITEKPVDETLNDLLPNFKAEEFSPYIWESVQQVIDHKEELDQVISRNLVNYTLDRLSFVDKQILRFATYEMIYKKEEVHPNVVINEGINLAKKYSDLDDQKASKFINRILDQINQDINQ